MRSSLKLTRVGMNMEEATIVKWHKQPGEAFQPGDRLYDFETEKVTQEVEATAPGTLLEISVPEGEVAQVGQVVCVVDVQLQGKA
jgi:pyruvate/2-oxoglutarate dehydrogenase complex dihydrolipoamide acyltransferase (E2) component